MKALERFVLPDQVRERHRLGNGGSRNSSVPFIRDFIPCHTSLNLFQDNPSHDPRPLVRRLAVTNLQVGHDVPAIRRVGLCHALSFNRLNHSLNRAGLQAP